MIKSCLLLATTVSFLQHAAQDAAPDMECGNKPSNSRRMSLSINSTWNGSDEWETTFSALKNTSSLSKNINLDVTHGSMECDGYQIVHIQGVIRGTPLEGDEQPLLFYKKGSSNTAIPNNDRTLHKINQTGFGAAHTSRPLEGHEQPLLFYQKGSSNTAITNNGRTLHKINQNGYGAALTSRPLKDDELFEVRIDEKNSNIAHGSAIGITTHSPTDLDIPENMNSLRSGTWTFYHNHLYQNGTAVHLNYLKTNMKDLQVGQRIGVMRTRDGILKAFINGVDQGPAASNVPSPVYGCFDLYGDSVKVTIVEITPNTSS